MVRQLEAPESESVYIYKVDEALCVEHHFCVGQLLEVAINGHIFHIFPLDLNQGLLEFLFSFSLLAQLVFISTSTWSC